MAKYPLHPPRKRRTREHLLADLSANHVARFALQCGFAAEELRQDYGLDLAVFTFDDQGYLESGVIWMQLKATDQLKTTRDSGAVLVPGSPGHSGLDCGTISGNLGGIRCEARLRVLAFDP